jgi:exopolyphosphatase/guanosine-5'-triphosphate,3'-diphosphate pyrophosphatase
MVRLGEGVDRTGRLSEAALGRAFAAIEEYAGLVGRHDVARLRFCATSATRDAANGDVFARGVQERLGCDIDVVTGAEEARLAFGGAVRHLRAAPLDPVLVVDIGGGSTELVLGAGRTPDAAPRAAHSMDIGSVRLHERHLHGDPPTPDQVAACVADIDAHLDASPVDVAQAATVVGVAGTVLTVVASALDLPAYDADAIDQAVVPVRRVDEVVDRLVGLSVAERLDLPYMHPGRADVIDAGALILRRVLARARVDSLIASEADILDGIAWSLVADRTG